MKFSIASKTFRTRTILGPITLELDTSRITALMGPSGSGKTTLLRILAGLDQDDRNTSHSPVKVGMVFQEPHLLPWKTVRENVEIAGPDKGLLAALGLKDAELLYPRQLSLGMARRVAFARALAGRPELLLLDEPFASLDSALVDLLRTKLLSFVEETGAYILVTTHHADDVLALNARSFKLEGSPAYLRMITPDELGPSRP